MQATHPAPSTHAVVIERAVALFLILHGIAHLVGTHASFAAASEGETLECRVAAARGGSEVTR
jgi:hypothetical protein